jgi:hypothetical protein
MILISILILFFILLVGLQIFKALSSLQIFKALNNYTGVKEGLENNDQTYKEYNTNDPNNPNSALILSQQNAGNIEFLKGRIVGLDTVNTTVNSMQQNINSMQTQIDALTNQQVEYAQSIGTPAPVEG